MALEGHTEFAAGAIVRVPPTMTLDFADRCQQLAPRFVVTGPLRRLRKSELLPGEIDGAPVIAKRMRKPNPVWDWYFAREVAVYRAFLATPPPFAAPHVFAAADDVLVIERLPIALATRRRPYASLAIEPLLAMCEAIAGYGFPGGAVPPLVKAELARRLLEDPTDPAWISAGLSRCHARGLIDDEVLAAARTALAGAPVCANHGDLLLRNAMRRGDGTVVLVDWECAGTHVADWDLALLWSQLDAVGRSTIDGRLAERRRFDALVVFALCRELVFLDAFRAPADHAGRRRVEADLAGVTTRLLG